MNIKNTLKKLNQKGFSHHVLMPVAVLVAVTAIGVKVLTQSHAAVVYTFAHGAKQMDGGTLVTKSGAISYRVLGCGSSRCLQNEVVVSTWVSKADLTDTVQICTDYLGGRGKLTIRHSSKSSGVSKVLTGSGAGVLCQSISPSDRVDSAVYVSIANNDGAVNSSQIDSIFGNDHIQ